MTTTDGESLEPMEYVLGMMDRQERRAFELALLDDPQLAADVWSAEEQLAPLQGALKARVPPKRVKKVIDKQLFTTTAKERRSGQFAAAFWRGVASLLGVAAVGAAAVIAVLVVRPEIVLPVQAPFIAAIVGNDGSITLARVRRDGSLIAEPFTASLGSGRDPELWAIAPGAKPVSLGLLSKEGVVDIPLAVIADEPLRGLRLVVTDEPAGGSPTGDPTGPAIAEGDLRQI